MTRQQEWAKRNPEKARVYVKRWQSKNREHLRQWEREYQRKRRLDPEYLAKDRERSARYMREKREKNPEFRKIQVARTVEWRQKLKAEVIAAYGGPVCVCCGEKEPLFLQLDHINGNGRLHRRTLGRNPSSYATYQDLKKRGFPPGFQVLCANCNMAKHLNGVCPHRAYN